jgi:predicted RNA methylase
MEILRGKQRASLEAGALDALIRAYRTVHIDLGTGDGRYVRHAAQANPAALVIGVDACRENLEATSRRVPDNALFVIANAHALPPALHGTAQRVTVNFPWGSLIDGLLTDGSPVLDGLRALTVTGAALDVRLNAGALAEAGWTLEAGADQVRGLLTRHGFSVQAALRWTARDLKAFPTTWAKRLAFGRDPQAIELRATRRG